MMAKIQVKTRLVLKAAGVAQEVKAKEDVQENK